MKILKAIFYLLFGSFLLMACESKPDKAICNSFYLNTGFIDSISGNDLTGDSVYLPLARYNKDSIRYMVLSQYDTTDLLKPVVKKAGFYNVYSFLYQFSLAPQAKYGEYKIIYFLNSSDKDSVFVSVINNNQDYIEVYKGNELLGTLGDECQFTVTIKK